MMSQVIRRLGARSEECYSWATHAGAVLDLLVVRGRRRLGFEFKRTDAPRATASMRSALETLRLGRLVVVHAGERTFPLGRNMQALAARDLLKELRPLGG
jgi:hypothetical protein